MHATEYGQPFSGVLVVAQPKFSQVWRRQAREGCAGVVASKFIKLSFLRHSINMHVLQRPKAGSLPARQRVCAAASEYVRPFAGVAMPNATPRLVYRTVPACDVQSSAHGRPSKRLTVAHAAEKPAEPAEPAPQPTPEEANAQIAPEVVISDELDPEKLRSGGSGIATGMRLANIAMTFKNQQASFGFGGSTN